MFVSIEDVINESIDDGRFSNCLVAEEDYLVFKKGGNSSFREI